MKNYLLEKKNISHEHATGEIIVYMDDDDYYPPTRISHAVDKLLKNPKAMCAGCSKIDVYFTKLNQVRRFGPYGKNHATANTFAFRRKLLDITSYQNDATFAEEKHFLKNYTIPFVQLHSRKTILVISHDSNTFDKNKIIKQSRLVNYKEISNLCL